ncbi:MAG: signal peptidase I [Fimbriimonadaceae bacterium]|nr:signal peptidase I [Fimbriimonadaceae bacterium]
MKNKPSRFAVTGLTVVLLFTLAFLIYGLKHFHTVQVKGESMLPTLQGGDRLLISRAYWLVGEVGRNDIVVVRNPEGGEPLIKRVIGLGGDPVNFEIAPTSWSIRRGVYRVPSGSLYVVGDNRPVSEDSRNLGPFDESEVLGKMVARENDVWLLAPLGVGVVAFGALLLTRGKRRVPE